MTLSWHPGHVLPDDWSCQLRSLWSYEKQPMVVHWYWLAENTHEIALLSRPALKARREEYPPKLFKRAGGGKTAEWRGWASIARWRRKVCRAELLGAKSLRTRTTCLILQRTQVCIGLVIAFNTLAGLEIPVYNELLSLMWHDSWRRSSTRPLRIISMIILQDFESHPSLWRFSSRHQFELGNCLLG